MGGYGAFKWALRQPERFAAAASLSAPLDIVAMQERDERPHIRELMTRVYDDRPLAGTGDDLIHLLGARPPAELPRLLLRCGTEDHTLAYNRRFAAACAARGVELDSGFGPGAHEWGYWDTEIRTVLDWLSATSV
jgi:putative tributyrin esterase